MLLPLLLNLQPTGGGSTTTVAPGEGTFTFTGYAPTILQSTNVTPSEGALTFTGYAPTVGQTANVDVTPGEGNLTFTGYAPAVTLTTALTPSEGNLTFSGYAPTVTQSLDVAPSEGTLIFTGYAPTVTQTANVAVTPDAGALTFTGYAPTVEQTGQPVYNPPSSAGAFGGGGGKGFRELVEKIQRNVEVLHREITTGKSPGKKAPAKPLQVAKLEVIPQLQELKAQIKALETELSQLRKEKALVAQLDADAEEEAVVTMLLL